MAGAYFYSTIQLFNGSTDVSPGLQALSEWAW